MEQVEPQPQWRGGHVSLLSELKVPRVGLSLSFRKSRTNQFPVGIKRSERHWYLPSVIR